MKVILLENIKRIGSIRKYPSIEEMKKRGYNEGGQVGTSFFDDLFGKFLGAQATGGLEIQGRRDTVPMQFWDGEKITVEEVTQDQIGGYAELGLIKQINDNLIMMRMGR